MAIARSRNPPKTSIVVKQSDAYIIYGSYPSVDNVSDQEATICRRTHLVSYSCTQEHVYKTLLTSGEVLVETEGSPEVTDALVEALRLQWAYGHPFAPRVRLEPERRAQRSAVSPNLSTLLVMLPSLSLSTADTRCAAGYSTCIPGKGKGHMVPIMIMPCSCRRTTVYLAITFGQSCQAVLGLIGYDSKHHAGPDGEEEVGKRGGEGGTKAPYGCKMLYVVSGQVT